MKFLRDMLSRKADRGAAKFGSTRQSLSPNESAMVAMEALKRDSGVPARSQAAGSPKPADIVGKTVPKPSHPSASLDAKPKPAAPLNIWDMDDGEPAAASAATRTAAAPAAAATPTDLAEVDAGARRRQNRTKTRMLNFVPKDDTVSDLFAQASVPAAQSDEPKSAAFMFPTGWLLVIDGPGRGASFPLNQGLSQIGRGSDQTVCLDFGDSAISRSYHAAIAFEPDSNKFHVGHGGKSNVVRLNQKPLLSTEVFSDGDTLQIGETILMLKVLCNASFNWGKTQPEGETNAVAFS
ncbi:MAG: FHA domain-containing protein [Paracoccaceae bacterium]